MILRAKTLRSDFRRFHSQRRYGDQSIAADDLVECEVIDVEFDESMAAHQVGRASAVRAGQPRETTNACSIPFFQAAIVGVAKHLVAAR